MILEVSDILKYLETTLDRGVYYQEDTHMLYFKNYGHFLEVFDLKYLSILIQKNKVDLFTGDVYERFKIVDFTVWDSYVYIIQMNTENLKKISLVDRNVLCQTEFVNICNQGMSGLSNYGDKMIVVAGFDNKQNVNCFFLMNQDLNRLGEMIKIENQIRHIHHMKIVSVNGILFLVASNMRHMIHIFAIKKLQKHNNERNDGDSAQLVIVRSKVEITKEDGTIGGFRLFKGFGKFGNNPDVGNLSKRKKPVNQGSIKKRKNIRLEIFVFGKDMMNRKITLKVPDVNF